MITAFATEEPFNAVELYSAFLEHETEETGTIVLHHGQIKRPGKQIPDFSSVILKPLVQDVHAELRVLAEQAKNRFNLNHIVVVHRLGVINARDSVLLVIVSGKTRDRCFDACSWVVDAIKEEKFISLIEQR